MSNQEKNEEWSKLVKLFTNVKSEELMDQLLHLFLTINEREFVLDRYNIIKALLTTDLPQRTIAEELGVSIAKITAGSNELKRTPQELKDFCIKQMHSKDKNGK